MKNKTTEVGGSIAKELRKDRGETPTECGYLALQKIQEGARFKPSADLLCASAASALATGLSASCSAGSSTMARGDEAIRAAGGLTLAQSELSCEFFDMLAAATAFGGADIIPPPQKFAAYLLLLGNSESFDHVA